MKSNTKEKNIKKVNNARKKITPAAQNAKAEKVSIIPLGGLDRIGMNMTAVRYGDSIIVVDCGIAFPDETMLGIDKVIPDTSFLEENADKLRAIFITHGHEDHIGAIAYVLPKLKVPVYATKLTLGLISHKLEEADCLDTADLRQVAQGTAVKAGEFEVEFVKVNHSVPDSSALAINTPAGMLFFTGDFKVDYTPLFGDAIDLRRIAQIGRGGVLAMMCDSTNALREGFTPSETNVAQTLSVLFTQNEKSRILVATFSSNIDRVQQVINTARAFGRKVILDGRSMETTIEIAEKLGYITLPKNTVIGMDELDRYPDNKLVIITTGSQGESMAALSRMASGTHKRVSIKPNDAIILSSSPIPGNEKAVAHIINELEMKGAKVIYRDTHVSGHACAQEILLMYTLLRPKYAVPLHGEFRHRKANAKLAESSGIARDNIFIIQSGDVLSLSAKGGKVIDKVQAGEIFVDGLGVGDVGNAVIHDRQLLSESGMVIVALTVDTASGTIVAGPEIVTRGFIYVRESEEILRGMEITAKNAIEKSLRRKTLDRARLRSVIKSEMEDYIWQLYERRPVVMTIIMETNS